MEPLEATAKATTEQADLNKEKDNKEKPEKKSRKWLRRALIVGGIATGIAGSSISIGGIPFIPLASVVVLLGSGLRQKRLEDQYNKLNKDIADRHLPKTEEEKKKLDEIEKILDIHKHIGEFAKPMALSSTLLYVISWFSPKISELGLDVKIKGTLKATWDKILTLRSPQSIDVAPKVDIPIPIIK